MKIAVLSDIHDNIWKLEKLLASLEADALIFCGDFCAPFTLSQIARGFGGPVHAVFGNNDGDRLHLARVARRHKHVQIHGDLAELEMGGRSVAVTHYPEIGRALARGGTYDLVCFGHSHEQVLEQEGRTLLLNPGEVMGRLGPSTYALYDTETGQAEIVEVR
ncbi:MAG: metallophosphoesterase [Anaerolineaceae bacterium]|nr:metallophosphoesterase [Anaerolineaceae bacterium]